MDATPAASPDNGIHWHVYLHKERLWRNVIDELTSPRDPAT